MKRSPAIATRRRGTASKSQSEQSEYAHRDARCTHARPVSGLVSDRLDDPASRLPAPSAVAHDDA